MLFRSNVFDNKDTMWTYYGALADRQGDFAYVAAFDKTAPDTNAEFGSAILTATVVAPAPRPSGGGGANWGLWGALLAMGLAGLVALKPRGRTPL